MNLQLYNNYYERIYSYMCYTQYLCILIFADRRCLFSELTNHDAFTLHRRMMADVDTWGGQNRADYSWDYTMPSRNYCHTWSGAGGKTTSGERIVVMLFAL